MSNKNWLNVNDHVHFHAHHGWYREAIILEIKTSYYPTSNGSQRASTFYKVEMEGDEGNPIWVQHGFCHLGQKDTCSLLHLNESGLRYES